MYDRCSAFAFCAYCASDSCICSLGPSADLSDSTALASLGLQKHFWFQWWHHILSSCTHDCIFAFMMVFVTLPSLPLSLPLSSYHDPGYLPIIPTTIHPFVYIQCFVNLGEILCQVFMDWRDCRRKAPPPSTEVQKLYFLLCWLWLHI